MSAISPSVDPVAAFAADLPQVLSDLLHLALDGLKRIIADESQPARERRLAAATALQYIARTQSVPRAAPRPRPDDSVPRAACCPCPEAPEHAKTQPSIPAPQPIAHTHAHTVSTPAPVTSPPLPRGQPLPTPTHNSTSSTSAPSTPTSPRAPSRLTPALLRALSAGPPLARTG